MFMTIGLAMRGKPMRMCLDVECRKCERPAKRHAYLSDKMFCDHCGTLAQTEEEVRAHFRPRISSN